jgi:hypothetical protein
MLKFSQAKSLIKLARNLKSCGVQRTALENAIARQASLTVAVGNKVEFLDIWKAQNLGDKIAQRVSKQDVSQ